MMTRYTCMIGIRTGIWSTHMKIMSTMLCSYVSILKILISLRRRRWIDLSRFGPYQQLKATLTLACWDTRLESTVLTSHTIMKEATSCQAVTTGKSRSGTTKQSNACTRLRMGTRTTSLPSTSTQTFLSSSQQVKTT
jgi:hypothetical protein